MPDLTSWTVLVVDDEPDNINVVQLVLEFNDIVVLTATSGVQALARLDEVLPTLLLIDIQMPEMSGLELLERIHQRWPDLPAIAMTAYTMQGDRERMLAAGFDGYIGKPVNVMTLVDEMAAVRERKDVKMTEQELFSARIKAHYPEGLTCMLAIGGTRTTYILDQNVQTQNPGQIGDMQHYGDDILDRMLKLIITYFELGGQNVIVPVLSYQSFESERGEAYADITARLALGLMSKSLRQFYKDNDIDPYFVGIDTLLRFPDHELAYRLGLEAAQFNQAWQYQTGRHKLIWEVAPIPLYSIWRAHDVMGQQAQMELEAELESASNLQAVHDTLYRYYARAVYGTELPTPHFYLGTNRNGDLKLRSVLPISLLCGGATRMFFTPYPTLYITRDTLQAVLEDLAFGKRLRSTQTDYSGQLTPELVAAERDRVITLSSDPRSTVGLARSVESDNSTRATQTGAD